MAAGPPTDSGHVHAPETETSLPIAVETPSGAIADRGDDATLLGVDVENLADLLDLDANGEAVVWPAGLTASVVRAVLAAATRA